MKILGISAFYHDSAAALVIDGNIIAAAQEERFTRKKHDEQFPKHAITYCLREGGIEAQDLDYIVFYDKPFLKFERIIETYLAFAPRGIRSFLRAIPLWIKKKLLIRDHIRKNLRYAGKILFLEHHESHAASAFFPSPFNEAAIVTIDGVGEWTTASIGVGEKNHILLKQEIHFPDSLGLLYSAFTYFCGFKVNSGEYKLMGLAPYGEPKYTDVILKNLIDIKEDSSFKINMKYFDYGVGLRMTNQNFADLFGALPRHPETPIRQIDMDLARSIQDVTEEIMLRIARYVHKKTNKRFLCLSGGVALNCVANGRLLKESPFENIWIQPASGDAGSALGAALFCWYQYLGNARYADNTHDVQKGSYLGPAFSNEAIQRFLDTKQVQYHTLFEIDLVDCVADKINAGAVVGWFQGRMEFGPRALGNRSIIGDARSAKMQEIMNVKIKFRESFRPFAPSVLYERREEYFDLKKESPYMLITVPIAEMQRKLMSVEESKLAGVKKVYGVRSTIPAVTHVDYSARVQTVRRGTNPLYYKLIQRFDEKYHCPVIINTSFNVRGEPIVCTPEDAYRCFMRTNMDCLVMGCYLLEKKEQPPQQNDSDWQKEFELD
jgi:carbamoyltransferase